MALCVTCRVLVETVRLRDPETCPKCGSELVDRERSFDDTEPTYSVREMNAAADGASAMIVREPEGMP